ncbi:DUF2332 domain-containing protein [Streptomyces sp. RKND-216]|uniref:DUF2332 domain-containing protein n=1 Tax=Streptomyces sp. RKND-216 TaxID=2562581 RepID=UPI00109E17EF|nr:DUF2332 domain-containing protein [Streptomyces sp. RKND-216]THA23536.1 DUF2332 domain-containing protein [Streptomyces sp. RKND-216]
MTSSHLVRMIEFQAAACGELGSPLYAAVLRRVAGDVRYGGVCAEALDGYEEAPGPDAVALRLLGGVHALVLTGRVPALAAHYPSAGGTFDPAREDDLWAAFRAAVAGHLPHVRDWMERPPQTNEVGRSNVLLAGALHAAARRPMPVRLFEVGSSAGLNLLADGFRLTAPGLAWGPEGSSVELRHGWERPVPEWLTEAVARSPELRVVERRGCDRDPVDPLSPAGALVLRAYLWPDQTARSARLEGALRRASEVPAPVARQDADAFLAGVRLRPGTLTVVWHSVMRQYVPGEAWERVERELDRLAAASGPDAGFAHVAFEPRRVGDDHRFLLSVRVDGGAEELLAEAAPHGLPARAFTG